MGTKRKTEERSARRTLLVPAAFASAAVLACATSFADEDIDYVDEDTGEATVDDVPDVRVPAVTRVPIYPASARRDRIEGEATVCFRIATDGGILDPEVESSTHEIFEEPALEAIRESTFEVLPPDEELSTAPVCRTYRFRLDPVETSDDV